ncbi:AAA family ATPase [Priestia megaterium]|uniref:AAA family ATPase n=1 Tax=Priestia megaterium TaxID=1404 RepID=UPI002877E77B|nr:AAA family ATPase [Priestia megaterium]
MPLLKYRETEGVKVEDGIRAISGVPFLPINNWRDFKKINKQLTDPKTIDKAKELYQTIIFDEVFTAARYCQDFLCKKHGVETIGEGNGGYGLWKEYENEFWTELDKLMKSGYTLLFIGHEQKDKDTEQIIPKGDVRSMQPIRDNADVVAYLTSNGIDEEGKVVKSSAWFAETEKFFARSRFDHIDTYLEEFTAENLEKVISVAIERQEEADGIKAVTYEEQKESFTSEELDYDQIMQELKGIAGEFQKAGKWDELTEVVEKHLGEGKRVTECKKSQVQVMAVILDELRDLLAE